MRRRLGRGGRIVYDRKNIPDSSKIVSEYQEVDFCTNIYVKRCDDVISSSSRSSLFHLDSVSVESNINLSDIELLCSFDE